MPIVTDPTDLLISEASLTPLAEVLSLPPDRLLGVTPDALATLGTMGVNNIFDLATSRVFDAAVQIDDAAANPGNPINRFGRAATDLLKPGISGAIPVPELRNQSVDILAAIDDATAVQNALGVLTVRDLSLYPPFLAAKEILSRVFFPEKLAEFDPEAPGDLIPKSGEFPTERVQYSALVLDQILRPDNAPPLIDLAGAAFAPIDISPVVQPSFGFTTLGLGMLLTFNQSWFMQGVTLGHLLHSMALAAGESTRIAVIDWSRKTSAGQTESIGETEDLTQDTTRNRSISEVTEAVAKEAQTGFSHTESQSTTKQAGVSAGISIGPFGGGASASIAKTTTSADSYATSAGSREVGASMLQNVSDRTHQHAHSARTRRASVVREVSQTEHEEVSTRVITNYNHMHAMTVQYYEVLQIYRTETALTRCERVVFVPFKLLDFGNVDILKRFRGALTEFALTEQVRAALENFDTLELVPERRVVFPRLGGTLIDILAKRPVVLTRSLARARPADGPGGPGTGGTGGLGDTDGDEVPPPVTPPRRPPLDDVIIDLWGDNAPRLASFIKTPTVRRDSQSLFVPADVRIEEGTVQSTVRALRVMFILRDGTKIRDLTASLPLSEVDRIAISGSDAAADAAATVMLALSRNGVVFPLELPTVTVTKNSQETPVIDVRAAGADVNLVQHLKDNQLHYSQAVFRFLDPAMIAGLLAPFSITINGASVPLVQVAEPIPLRIVGNALAFKINTDPINDAEWRAFMASRGLVVGQAKVDIVPLSSGGIFAESVLGRFNCAEKLDISRFFNWQDSPIPIQPSEIAAIQTGSRARDENLTPSQLSAPIVNITQPAAAPDPTGIAGALAAVQNGSMFRDMSGLAETIKLAGETAKLSAAGATAVGNQASENMKTAVNADTERRRIAAQLEAAKIGKSLQDKNMTEAGAVVNKEEELKKKAADAAQKGAGGTSGGSGGSGNNPGGSGSGGGGTPNNGVKSPTTTGNSALDRIIGNDESLRNFIGLPSGSPAPTPQVTAEGVPLQTWDFYGFSSLVTKPTSAADPESPSVADIQALIANNFFKASTNDVEAMLLGDRKVFGTGLDTLLKSLSIVPAGSVAKLNIVAHATAADRLDFDVTFTHVRGSPELPDGKAKEEASRPLQSVELKDLVSLLATPDVSVGGIPVKLADVRKAFPVDAEIRIFNMGNPIREDYIQALANVFQVRTSAFTRKPIRVSPTVIGETSDEEPLLSRKTEVGFAGDAPGTKFDFFENILTLDRAVTGVVTAFPRR